MAERSDPCAVHGAEPSVTHCASCDASMCDACFRFLVRFEPSCVRCAYEIRTRARRRISLGVFVGLVAVGGAAVGGIRIDHSLAVPVAALTGLLGLGLGIWLVHGALAEDPAAQLKARTDELPAPGVTASRQRIRAARARRAVAALAPAISGRATVLGILAAMAFAAVSFPVGLRLPRWVEVEVVLAAWWLMATVALCTLLYRGYRVEDDHFFYAPRLPDHAAKFWKDGADCSSGCDPGCAADGCEGAVALIGVVLIAALITLLSLVVAWLIVELALPLAFLAFYVTLLAAVRRVARDRHDCRGRLGASLRWGALWSTLYFAPPALVVWMIRLATLR
jgi:hypothetical protein